MPASVLFVGLDACDCALASRLADAGRMPHLARLLARGVAAPVEHPYGVWVSALWPTFWTACLPHHLDYYCWIELRPESYRMSLTDVQRIERRPFWETLSESGLRVAVLDVPHASPPVALNGVFLGEWGAHDRHHGLAAYPPEFRDEVLRRYGLHPDAQLDTYARRQFATADWVHRRGALFDAEGLERTYQEWLEGVACKERLVTDLLERESWDLVVACMGEAHDLGHLLWHLHDPDHPRFDRELRERLGDPIEATYARLDAAVGRFVEAAGPDATVVLFLSHGMGPHYDGGAVLDEALRRIERRCLDGEAGSRGAWGRAKGLWRRAPAALHRRGAPLAAALLRRRYGGDFSAFAGEDPPPGELPARRFYRVPNNDAFGGIRFNLAGREASGRVAPGELEQLTRLLRRELALLVNLDSGEPVVEAIVRLEDRLQRPAEGDSWPDLVVEWNRRRPIESVWSPTIGAIHRRDRNLRTGDHRARSLVVAAGPARAPGRRLPPVPSVDLAPSLAALLGRELPGVDGRPAPGLAPRQGA